MADEWTHHGVYDRAVCLEFAQEILSALDSMIRALDSGKGTGRKQAVELARRTRKDAQLLHDFMENPDA